jgi:hypothetical protein
VIDFFAISLLLGDRAFDEPPGLGHLAALEVFPGLRQESERLAE